MNDSLHDYHWMQNFEYRRSQLMDEARRERLKANVLRRAKQQSRSRHLLNAVNGKVAALLTRLNGLQGRAALDPPRVVDDCLESSPV